MLRLKFAHLPILLLSLALPSLAQTPINTSALGEMHWRGIGPLRAGRTRAAVGVPSEPNIFYIGAVNGGVWKTTDFGRTWQPIFDGEPTGSIGYIVVSPSDPNIIYVGSGEGLHRPDLSVGDGIYKSTDAGKSWTHLGLRDGQQISQMAIDPHDPNRLFVAVAGHPYGPNKERGVYRSTDGGQTFQAVLQKGENIGAAGVVIDPRNPNTVYATLWEAREGPWENAEWNGPHGGIFKSTDGGQNWQQLSGGLPSGIVQAYVAISASNPQRLFASVATGEKVDLYRSDDGGATWVIATNDPRPRGRIGGGDLPMPAIDPKNPDVMYMTSTVTWKSTDAGKTWTGFRGAPGGDDYQNIWINPNDPRSFCWPAIRARSSPSMAASRGAPGTTSPPRRCTTSAPTTLSPIACAAASRRAARRASAAGATTAKLPSATGIRWPQKSTDMSLPIPLTPTLFMAAR